LVFNVAVRCIMCVSLGSFCAHNKLICFRAS
jgi:hypothetical protein